jgi:uncharacterized protein (DUF952 family)
MDRIFHVAVPEKWASVSGGQYEHASLAAEGFIHCSFADQLDGVLSRYFSNVGEVTILEIDPARLTSKLVIEPSTNGERFPHIYGPIDLDAVVATETRKLR